MQYLYFSSGTLILFIIALIAGKKTRALPDHILLAWLLVILANLATFFVMNADDRAKNGWETVLVVFSEVSLFLHGPLIWWYTCSLTRPFFRLKAEDARHLAPFAVGLVLLLLIGMNNGQTGYVFRTWLLFFKLISLLIYTIAVIRELRRYRESVKHIFSNTEEKYLDWLCFLSWGMLMLWVLATCSIVIGLMTDITLPIYDNAFPRIATSLFIVAMCYFAIRQSPIVYFRGRADALEGVRDKKEMDGGEGMEEGKVIDDWRMMEEGKVMDGGKLDVREGVSGEDMEQDREGVGGEELTDGREGMDRGDMDAPAIKYRKSGLGAGQSGKLYRQLLEVMETRKPYLDADLTLFSLAAILNWSPNHLSQVINTHERKNFFDFVNGYRIEAIKKNILSQQFEHLTLLSIAFECGFNSKAAFNRAFKKITGMTPSAFRRGK